jgi:diguanylate cyclase (GGDEF)-like protein
MSSEFAALTALTLSLQDRLSLDVLLQRIVDGASSLLSTPRVSVRLLDPTRTRLLATCRAGAPLHLNPGSEFRLGEGLIGWIAQEGKPIRTGEAEQDPRFQPRADIKEPMRSFLGVPLVSGRACMGVLSALHPEGDHFDAHHEELLTLLAGICAPHVEVARLQRLSQVDPLTGALNRRGLELEFPDGDVTVLAPLSVVMADVDRFKRINDAYGHAIGDEVLKRVAQLLSGVMRSGDAVIRYGGEEFLMILPRVGLAMAGRIAERAREAVAEGGINAAGVEIRMTISLGVAERSDDESRESVIKRADEALYEAKSGGRNRVVLADRRKSS